MTHRHIHSVPPTKKLRALINASTTKTRAVLLVLDAALPDVAVDDAEELALAEEPILATDAVDALVALPVSTVVPIVPAVAVLVPVLPLPLLALVVPIPLPSLVELTVTVSHSAVVLASTNPLNPKLTAIPSLSVTPA